MKDLYENFDFFFKKNHIFFYKVFLYGEKDGDSGLLKNLENRCFIAILLL